MKDIVHQLAGNITRNNRVRIKSNWGRRKKRTMTSDPLSVSLLQKKMTKYLQVTDVE